MFEIGPGWGVERIREIKKFEAAKRIREGYSVLGV